LRPCARDLPAEAGVGYACAVRLFAFALLTTLCACKHSVPPSGYGVDLTIDARELTQIKSVTAITVATSGAETFSTGAIDAQKQIAHGGVVRIRYVPQVASGTLVFDVDALDKSAMPIGNAQSPVVTLVPGHAVQLTIVLMDPMVQVLDMALADTKPATCSNNMLDPDETDVDCGGPCAPCEPGKHCNSDTDCATHTCTATSSQTDMLVRVCELATGPPGWVVVAPLPAGRAFMGAVGPSDGTLLVVGGHTTANDASTLQLSFATNTWTDVATMSVAREAMPVVLAGDKVFAIGGEYTPTVGMPDQATTAIEVLDLTSMMWTVQMRALGAPRAFFPGTYAGDNLVYVLGGEAYPDTTPIATVGSFDPTTDAAGALLAHPDLPLARSSAAAATDSLGRVLAIGGIVTSGTTTTPQSEVDIYDTTTMTWMQGPPLGTPRGNLGAALGPDGRVYAVGGQNSVGGSLADVEALAPNSDHWTALPTISPARLGLAVTRGWDGRIYAIGGKLQGGAEDTTVQAYGPSLAPGPTSGAVGTAVALAGSNFAGNANVTIQVTDGTTTMAAATGVTNATGTLTPSPVWKVPSTMTAGTYTLIATDDRSRYPVQARFTVTP